MTWLHDDDSLRSLSEEEGPIGQWACFQRAARNIPGPLPTRDLYRGAIAVMAPPGWERWIAEQLEDGTFISVLEHAVAHGVIPQDRSTWIGACDDGLDGSRAAAAASTLVRLGVSLSADQLRRAVAAAPTSPVAAAWVACTDLTAVPALAKGVPPDHLVESIELLLQTEMPAELAPLEALQSGLRRSGASTAEAGQGSSRRRMERLLRPLAEGVGGALGALVVAAIDAEVPLPAHIAYGTALWAGSQDLTPAERYARGIFDCEAIAAGRANGPAREAAVAIVRAEEPPSPPLSLYAQQALVSRRPDLLLPLFDTDPRTAFQLAPFAPTEAVMERLFTCPHPSDHAVAYDLAFALIHTGVPTAMSRVRSLATDLEEHQTRWLSAESMSFYREAV